jgi:hypothetical protein
MKTCDDFFVLCLVVALMKLFVQELIVSDEIRRIGMAICVNNIDNASSCLSCH